MDRSARQLGPALAVTGATALLGCLFAVGVLGSWNGPLPAAQEAPAAAAPGEREVGLFLTPDRFLRGDSLSDVLTRNGFSRAQVFEIAEALHSVADVRRLRTGQTIWLHRSGSGLPSRIELPLDDFREVTVVRTLDGWAAEEITAERSQRAETVQGLITTSLSASLADAGERAGLAVLIARALEYDIDFHRDSRRGDGYSVVVEKTYDADGEWRGYGELLGVRYVNAGRPIHAFRFELPSGGSGYYDFDGNSIQRTFLMSPVTYSRISGVFTSRRLHPVHRVYRPHYGVDYAAPHGTPVMATADGVVTDAGRRGPNGNMVTLRHSGGYVTKYLHLSRFAPEVRAGRRVRQRQVIGYVGSTGVSTGPHVDYRLSRHGRPLNPRTHTLPPGPQIPPEHLSAFEAWRNQLLADFEGTRRRLRPTTALDAGSGGGA